MKTNILAFLELVTLGIKQGDSYATVEEYYKALDWKFLFRLAREQSVIGLLADGIQALPEELRPPQELYEHSRNMAEKIAHSNRMQNKQCVDLFKLLNGQGIPATLMRGQGVGLNYPCALSRQCGQIDAFVSAKSFDRANGLVDEYGVLAELHMKMAILARPLHVKHFVAMRRAWFPKGIELVELDGVLIGVAPAQFDAVYLVGHVFKHLVMEAVGLSRPIDWLLFMDRHKEGLDMVQLEMDLKRTGLLEFAAALIGVGVQYLGFEQLEGVLKHRAKEGHVGRLFEEILQLGSFGLKEKAKKTDPIKRGFVVSRTDSFIHTVGRLCRMYPLAKGEALWRFWLVLRRSLCKKYFRE